MEDLKIKLAVLWLFYTVAFLAVLTLGLAEPGALEQLMAGEIGGMKITPELMLLLAVIILTPLIMAFLSLTLKGSAIRWANIIVGLVYTGLQLFALVENLAQPSAWAILMEVAKVVAPALIVWYAWKWPKN